MFLFQSCCDSATVLSHSINEQAVLSGISDIIVVKQKSGSFRSSDFIVCFGGQAKLREDQIVKVVINNCVVDVGFQVDRKGYIYPKHLSDKNMEKLKLRFGCNKAVFILQEMELNAEIYLYSDNDKLVVSDVDGTLTKNDIGGHLNNMVSRDYLHEDYANLIRRIKQQGYHPVWLTMRALPLYSYSKEYIRQTVGVDGPIMMEPEELLPAITNEVLKKTANIKINMTKMISRLFTVNPFGGGLGNRQNDAIAYYQAGMPLDQIFIIDTKSRVQQMDCGTSFKTYGEMASNVQKYFPLYSAPKMGYI